MPVDVICHEVLIALEGFAGRRGLFWGIAGNFLCCGERNGISRLPSAMPWSTSSTRGSWRVTACTAGRMNLLVRRTKGSSVAGLISDDRKCAA